ncbi:MAG TPA: PDZ domain-containing protein [Acidimicrobiales bacterium]|nr:PDZ domain-containing protein [Acidimicrobiales bacterium]
MLQEAPPRAQRPKVLLIAGIVVILLFAGAVGLLKIGADGYYVLSPGQAPVVTASQQCRAAGGGSFSLPGGKPCVQLVVPPGRAHGTTGTIMMVDVYEGKPNPLQYLIYKLGWQKTFENHVQFVPNKNIIGNGTPEQLNCNNTQQAMQATSAAPVAALRRLGYTVKEEDVGAQLDAVLPGTPASAAGLQCNDLVTAVNGAPVRSAQDIGASIKPLAPGTEVHLTVIRSTAQGSSRTLVLTARLSGTPARAGLAANPNKPFLGVESETRTKYDFPFPVSANVGSIGGPSDGLALALGFIDTLDQGRLTGGLAVAATGTIDPDGNVGEIGGAAQKAVAVRNAGAKVFLVPKGNYAEAKSEAGSMKVFAVSSLNQALADLQSLGGQVPAPTAHATAVTE